LKDVAGNFEKLLRECKISQGNTPQIAIREIEKLETIYSLEDLVEIYNFFLINAKNSEVMAHLIKLLDKFRHPSSLPVITALLCLDPPFENLVRENFINVRSLCAKAISNYKNRDSIIPLLNCLNNKSENYKLRLSCAESLGKIGDKFAVTPLIDILSDEEEKSVYLKESAAIALGMIGDMRALEPFLGILDSKRGIIDKFTFLKERIIEALGKINPGNNERVFKALKNSLMDESPQIRIGAIEALMNSEDSRAVGLIKESLQDGDDEVKRNAVIALYNLEGEEILQDILRHDNFDSVCKEEAERILGEENV